MLGDKTKLFKEFYSYFALHDESDGEGDIRTAVVLLLLLHRWFRLQCCHHALVLVMLVMKMMVMVRCGRGGSQGGQTGEAGVSGQESLWLATSLQQ